MFRVDYHWDRLKTCVVGITYPPEHFSWVTDPNIRSSLERLVQETEEDFQKLIALLQSFGVQIVRPLLPEEGQHLMKPVIAPRDHMAMIGDRFFCDVGDFTASGSRQRQMAPIINLVRDQGNEVIINQGINSAEVIRLGKDLYWSYPEEHLPVIDMFEKGKQNLDYRKYNKIISMLNYHNKHDKIKERFENKIQSLFKDYNNHFLGVEGHIDGCVVALMNNLMLVRGDIDDYYTRATDVHFPGWHKITMYPTDVGLKDPAIAHSKKWWIQGKEIDHALTDFIDYYMNHWTNDISETIFAANTLIIDSKNVVCVGYTDEVLKAYQDRGITPHVIDFRHRYFWDGGIHCITADLDRGD